MVVEVQTSGDIGQPDQLNQWDPGSLRDSASENKGEKLKQTPIIGFWHPHPHTQYVYMCANTQTTHTHTHMHNQGHLETIKYGQDPEVNQLIEGVPEIIDRQE